MEKVKNIGILQRTLNKTFYISEDHRSVDGPQYERTTRFQTAHCHHNQFQPPEGLVRLYLEINNKKLDIGCGWIPVKLQSE